MKAIKTSASWKKRVAEKISTGNIVPLTWLFNGPRDGEWLHHFPGAACSSAWQTVWWKFFFYIQFNPALVQLESISICAFRQIKAEGNIPVLTCLARLVTFTRHSTRQGRKWVFSVQTSPLWMTQANQQVSNIMDDLLRGSWETGLTICPFEGSQPFLPFPLIVVYFRNYTSHFKGNQQNNYRISVLPI